MKALVVLFFNLILLKPKITYMLKLRASYLGRKKSMVSRGIAEASSWLPVRRALLHNSCIVRAGWTSRSVIWSNTVKATFWCLDFQSLWLEPIWSWTTSTPQCCWATPRPLKTVDQITCLGHDNVFIWGVDDQNPIFITLQMSGAMGNRRPDLHDWQGCQFIVITGGFIGIREDISNGIWPA